MWNDISFYRVDAICLDFRCILLLWRIILALFGACSGSIEIGFGRGIGACSGTGPDHLCLWYNPPVYGLALASFPFSSFLFLFWSFPIREPFLSSILFVLSLTPVHAQGTSSISSFCTSFDQTSLCLIPKEGSAVNHVLNNSTMSQAMLPPGFRFHPTDEELILYYLKRKVMGKRFQFMPISEVELYKFAPWDLPGTLTFLIYLHISNKNSLSKPGRQYWPIFECHTSLCLNQIQNENNILRWREI